MRRSTAMGALVVTATLIAGCGQTTSTETGSPSVPSTTPSVEASEPVASLPGESLSSGSFQAEMTGAANRTWNLQLATDVSFINGDTFNLVFGSSSEAGLGENVAIYLESGNFEINSDGATADFDGQTGEGCTHELDRSDESGVSGTFECTQLTAIASDETVIGPVDVSGSFEADH